MNRAFQAEGWHLKPFNIVQQNEVEIKRDFYHILIGLHFQREAAKTRTLMCWPFPSLYHLKCLEEKIWFGLSEDKLSSTDKYKFPLPFSIWNKLIAIILTVFPVWVF